MILASKTTKVCNFRSDLGWSVEQRATDEETLRGAWPGYRVVQASTTERDLSGVDFMVYDHSGNVISVDVKRRRPGCVTHWRRNGIGWAGIRHYPGEQEFALENWSSKPHGLYPGKIGWTKDPSKKCNYILFAFDQKDSTNGFLLPFAHIRAAYIEFEPEWERHYGPYKQQDNRNYDSSCLFVPRSVVYEGVRQVSIVTPKSDIVIPAPREQLRLGF